MLAKLWGICSLILFVALSLNADSVWYNESLSLEGKIVSQNAYEIFLETDDGVLYRIKKSAVKKIKYDLPQKQVISEEKKSATKTEVLTLSTNTNDKSTRSLPLLPNQPPAQIQQKNDDVVLLSNIYYQVLKDSRTYLIRLEGDNFKKIEKVLLENSQFTNEPEIYNLQAKSFEMIVKSNDLNLGFYDLVIQSKTGTKIRKEYFVEVKEP